MSILLTIIHIIVCFMLIAVILLQAGRGQGLSGATFGGGNVQSLFGTKGSVFLSKATTVAAIAFMFTCLGLDFLEIQKSRSLFRVQETAPPIDVDKIKKALDKVKGESQEAAEAPVVQEMAAEATPVAEQAVADIKDAVHETTE